jgi:hypothetical protein
MAENTAGLVRDFRATDEFIAFWVILWCSIWAKDESYRATVISLLSPKMEL